MYRLTWSQLISLRGFFAWIETVRWDVQLHVCRSRGQLPKRIIMKRNNFLESLIRDHQLFIIFPSLVILWTDCMHAHIESLKSYDLELFILDYRENLKALSIK